MAIVTGDRYLECLVKFVEQQAGPLLEGTTVLKLNPVGLHYVQSRIDALAELESLLAGAPVDYLRAYILDLGDHRALEQLRRILRLLTSLKVVSVLPPPARDPTPLSLLLFGRLKVLELRGCDLSTSAARGLLELRHTLEKIICHNSTDALRHVFASRIVEIKDSSQWNRLQFISCACNNLVLMDESLQLLPAVETLDLSRNKFAKVDNLRKCTKLKHLDLGFNHLRTTAALSEVSCHIVKLVLRNNALTSLRGLENLKSVEGLDLSYNIISNFSEIEILASLPYLWNLWLEGNPLCCARWYRAQVFSYFINPDKLALDERRISAREFWKRQIINASRQKRPASFGFYSPAKEDAGEDGSINVKKKKSSRLACIESDGQAVCVGSDFESASCENEIRSREEKILSDDEYEIVDLMNRVEFMKKQRPIFWLHEFEEWMDQASDNFLEHSRSGATDDHGEIIHMKIKARQQHFGESSKCLSESVQALRDDSSSNILESVTSSDLSGNMHSHQHFDQIDEAASRILPDSIGGNCTHLMGKMEPRQEHPRSRSLESVSYRSKCQKSQSRTVSSHGDQMAKPFTAIGDILDPHSLSIYPASPPHYQQDILKRRHNLVEEILQLSSESFSVTSSDSASSDDGDHLCARPLVPGQDQSLGMDVDMGSAKNYFGDKYNGLGLLQVSENDTPALDFLSETASSSQKELLSDQDPPCCGSSGVNDSEFPYSSSQSAEVVERKKCRRKPKRREIFLPDATDVCNNEPSQTLNGVRDACKGDHESEEVKLSNDGKCYRELTRDGALKPLAGSKQSSLVTDHVVQNYFILNLADSSVDETCRQYVHCDCLFEQELRCGEVALILSSQDKLFVLEIDVEYDGSGTFLRRMGCHRLDEVKEVTVGMSLQVVRVYIEGNMSYLFITKCIKKSKQILCALHIFNNTFSLRSIEQIQAELFKKQIVRGYEVCMFQYSMVLFWRSDNKAESGLSRSLFVTGEHLFVCVEDIRKFSSLSEDLFSSPYFTLDSSCHVGDVTEMVIDTRESWCVSLALKSATMGEVEQVIANDKKKTTSGPLSWKLMWVSESSLLKFAALMKALHSGTTASPLLVRCIH